MSPPLKSSFLPPRSFIMQTSISPALSTPSCVGSPSRPTCTASTTAPSREETDSNFGFNLPWWDLLFGTYRAQPREPHETMTLGLDDARDPRKLDLFSLLGRPFKKAA